jgi:hypothetical protein
VITVRATSGCWTANARLKVEYGRGGDAGDGGGDHLDAQAFLGRAAEHEIDEKGEHGTDDAADAAVADRMEAFFDQRGAKDDGGEIEQPEAENRRRRDRQVGKHRPQSVLPLTVHASS